MNSPRRAEENLRFQLRPEAACEDFDGRALVLLCDSLQLRELNAAARKIVARLDGRRTVKDIAGALAAESGTPEPETLVSVRDALLQMEAQGVVRRMVKLVAERPENMSAAKYLVDPDISFRQEDDGGLLYNVETDSLEVLNPVAVAIWSFLAAPRTQAEVVDHLCAVCAGAVREQVEQDTGEFLESMLKKGFIGVVEEPA